MMQAAGAQPAPKHEIVKRDRMVELGGAVPAKAERGPAHLSAVLQKDMAKWQPILQSAMAEQK